jgi:hypothetical protein
VTTRQPKGCIRCPEVDLRKYSWGQNRRNLRALLDIGRYDFPPCRSSRILGPATIPTVRLGRFVLRRTARRRPGEVPGWAQLCPKCSLVFLQYPAAEKLCEELEAHGFVKCIPGGHSPACVLLTKNGRDYCHENGLG